MEKFKLIKGGEVAWEGIIDRLRKVTELLGEREGEGLFFRGREVAHVDFLWVGILIFVRALREDV